MKIILQLQIVGMLRKISPHTQGNYHEQRVIVSSIVTVYAIFQNTINSRVLLMAVWKGTYNQC